MFPNIDQISLNLVGGAKKDARSDVLFILLTDLSKIPAFGVVWSKFTIVAGNQLNDWPSHSRRHGSCGCCKLKLTFSHSSYH